MRLTRWRPAGTAQHGPASAGPAQHRASQPGPGQAGRGHRARAGLRDVLRYVGDVRCGADRGRLVARRRGARPGVRRCARAHRPALFALRGRWRLLRRSARLVVPYGLVGVAACQVCYFNAIARMDVGISILLEYLGIVLIVGWLWVRHGQRPRPLTVLGGVAALGGLALMLDLSGSGGVSLTGVLWALAAAVAMAVYFFLSARRRGRRRRRAAAGGADLGRHGNRGGRDRAARRWSAWCRCGSTRPT